MEKDSLCRIELKQKSSNYFPEMSGSSVTELLLFSLIFIGLTALLQFHWKRRRMYRMAAKIAGPTSFPLIGSAHLFAGSTFNILDSVCKLMTDYDTPVTIWLGHRLFFGVTKPEHLEIIFNSPKAVGKDDLYKYANAVVGEGLFAAPVPKWKKNRKLIAPTFNQKILNTFCEVFAKQATIFVECIKKVEGKEFDVIHFLDKCTLDIVCETSMGVKINAQNTNNEFGTLVEKILGIVFQRMFKIWYHSDFIFYKLAIGKEFRSNIKKFHDFTDNVIKNKKEVIAKRNKLRQEYPEAQIEETKEIKTFLDLLIELSEDGRQLTDIELRDEVNTFLIAGSDTTATTLSFAFVMLGMHREIQQKVYEEVMDVIGPEKYVEYSDLPNLKYTERVLKEVMRLFPIGPLVVRAHEEDIEMGKYILPAGSSSVLVIIHTHRNPLYWPDPLKFDPDRFLPEEVAKRHPFTYIPFTGGPRICIGAKYGMMLLKTIVAHTVRSFIISTSYKTVADVIVKQDLIIKSVDGYKIRVDHRT